jgi:hypothetical protein
MIKVFLRRNRPGAELHRYDSSGVHATEAKIGSKWIGSKLPETNTMTLLGFEE